MFSLAVFGASYSTAQVDTDTPLLTDPIWYQNSAGHLIPQAATYVRWAHAMGLLLYRARLKTPRLLPFGRPIIRPVEQAANPSSRPQFAETFRAPIRLNAQEELAALLSTTTAVAERDFLCLALGDNQFTAPQGDIFTIRLTSTFASVANAWANGTMTLDDTLAVGKYSVVGMENQEATGCYARLIAVGSPYPGTTATGRPGVISITSLANQGTRFFRYGIQGEYLKFDSFALPNLEVINTAASVIVRDTYLDIVQLQSQAP